MEDNKKSIAEMIKSPKKDELSGILSKNFTLYFAIKNEIQQKYKFIAFLLTLLMLTIAYVSSLFDMNITVINIIVVYSYSAIFSLYALREKAIYEINNNSKYSLDFTKNKATKKIHKDYIKLAKSNTLLTYISLYVLVVQTILSDNIIDIIISIVLLVPIIIIDKYKAHIRMLELWKYQNKNEYIYITILAIISFLVRNNIELTLRPLIIMPFIVIYGIIKYFKTKKLLNVLMPNIHDMDMKNKDNYMSNYNIYHLDDVEILTPSKVKGMKITKQYEAEKEKKQAEAEAKKKQPKAFNPLVEEIIFGKINAKYDAITKQKNTSKNKNNREAGYTNNTDNKNAVNRFKAKHNR